MAKIIDSLVEYMLSREFRRNCRRKLFKRERATSRFPCGDRLGIDLEAG